LSNDAAVTPGRTARPQEILVSPAVKQLNKEGYIIYNTPVKQDVYVTIQPESAFFDDEEPKMVRMSGGFVGAEKNDSSAEMPTMPEREPESMMYVQPADIFSNALRREEFEEIDFNEIIIKKNDSFETEYETAPMLFKPSYEDVPEPIEEESFKMGAEHEAAMTSSAEVKAEHETIFFGGFREEPEYDLQEVSDEKIPVTEVPAGLYVDGYKQIDPAEADDEETDELSSFKEIMSTEVETAITSVSAAAENMATPPMDYRCHSVPEEAESAADMICDITQEETEPIAEIMPDTVEEDIESVAEIIPETVEEEAELASEIVADVTEPIAEAMPEIVVEDVMSEAETVPEAVVEEAEPAAEIASEIVADVTEPIAEIMPEAVVEEAELAVEALPEIVAVDEEPIVEMETEAVAEETEPIAEIIPEVVTVDEEPAVEVIFEIVEEEAEPVVEILPEIVAVEEEPVVETLPEIVAVEEEPVVETLPEIVAVEEEPVVETLPEIVAVEEEPVIEVATEVVAEEAEPIAEVMPETIAVEEEPAVEIVTEVVADVTEPVVEIVPEIVAEEETETVAGVPAQIEIFDEVADLMKITIPGLRMSDDLMLELAQDWQRTIPEDGLEAHDHIFRPMRIPVKEENISCTSSGHEGRRSAGKPDPYFNFRVD